MCDHSLLLFIKPTASRVKWEGRWRHCKGKVKAEREIEGNGEAGEGGSSPTRPSRQVEGRPKASAAPSRQAEGMPRHRRRLQGRLKACQAIGGASKAGWRQAEGIGGAFKAGWRQAKAPSVEGRLKACQGIGGASKAGWRQAKATSVQSRLKASWRQAEASAMPLGQVEGSARNKDFIFIQLNKQVFTGSWKLNGYLFIVQK